MMDDCSQSEQKGFSLNTGKFYLPFGLVSHFSFILDDFMVLTVVAQKCAHTWVSLWEMQIKVCCFQWLLLNQKKSQLTMDENNEKK